MFIDQRTPFFPASPMNAQQKTIWKSLGIDTIVASSTTLLCFSLLSVAWLVHSNHSFHGDWDPPLNSRGWTVIRSNPTHLISSPWFKHEHVIQIWLIKSEGKSFEEFSWGISLKLKKKTKTITFLFLCLDFSVWAGNCCPISGSQREPTSEAKLNCPGSLRRKRETARILEGTESLILPAQELSCL